MSVTCVGMGSCITGSDNSMCSKEIHKFQFLLKCTFCQKSFFPADFFNIKPSGNTYTVSR